MGMNSAIYKALEPSNASWTCCQYGIPNFSTSLFESVIAKFAKISGKYVLFDVAVFDLQYTLLVRQIEVLSARSICTFIGKFRTTQELEYFFLSRQARNFFPEYNIRLYDKNSESESYKNKQ
jgi:hypothetical protein